MSSKREVSSHVGADVYRFLKNLYTSSPVQRAPTIYGGPDLSRCWLAYASDDFDTRALRSSIVVFIDRANGSVLYAGSANDDG
jgi:hypothetical protein